MKKKNGCKLWIIRGINETDPVTDEPLYWGQDGWTVKRAAMRFYGRDKHKVRMPLDGRWEAYAKKKKLIKKYAIVEFRNGGAGVYLFKSRRHLNIEDVAEYLTNHEDFNEERDSIQLIDGGPFECRIK